ncbi:hypothetical protein A3770_06p45780 [Chloropicon primus]|uniref:Uncharacterized protein n=1 Tax=Chloropicon primus TaxID=1764295 RepID=A0A5B8MRM5_9CHLO|nr:hypothetical protein A3770_06p45780 [Chloropicon primus]|eukprot:QDZ22060.1 hypothetical protein A3770_06p45780 [Chloropicon primus]
MDCAQEMKYVEDLDVETVKDKIVLLQFSNCATTWTEANQEYFHTSLYFLMSTSARGMIFAERYRGKLPGVSVLGENLQNFMPPSCIITAESYDKVLQTYIREAGGSNTIHQGSSWEADMSSVSFPPLKAPDAGDPVQVSLTQAYKLFNSFKYGDKAEAMDTFIESFEFLYPLQYINFLGEATELPLGRANNLGPQVNPQIISEMVVVRRNGTCMQKSYSACASHCYGRPLSEMFDSQELAGKIALVIIPESQSEESSVMEGCFRSLQDYPILLQELGVSAVILSLGEDFELPHRDQAVPFADIKVPVLLAPLSYAKYLNFTNQLGERPEGEPLAPALFIKNATLPAVSDLLDVMNLGVMRKQPHFKYLPFGAPANQIVHTRKNSSAAVGLSEMMSKYFADPMNGDYFLRSLDAMLGEQYRFTVSEVTPEKSDSSATETGARGSVTYSYMHGIQDTFFSGAESNHSYWNQNYFDPPRFDDDVAAWKGMRMLQLKPTDHCTPPPGTLMGFCLDSCVGSGYFQPLANITAYDDVALLFDESEHVCLPTREIYLRALSELNFTNVRALLVGSDETTKVSTFVHREEGADFGVYDVHLDILSRYREASVLDLNKKEVYLSRDVVEEELTRFCSSGHIVESFRQAVRGMLNGLNITGGEGGEMYDLENASSLPFAVEQLRENIGDMCGEFDKKATKAIKVLHPRSSVLRRQRKEKENKPILWESYNRIGLEFAGVATDSASLESFSGEVVLVETHPSCSSIDCTGCNERFNDVDLRGKIAFIPFLREEYLQDNYVADFYLAIDQNVTVEEVLSNQKDFLSILRSSAQERMQAAGGIHASCLLPTYNLMRLLKERGASAVVFGNDMYEIYRTTFRGWMAEDTIPMLNINDLASREWYRILKHANESLIVDVRSWNRISSVDLAEIFLQRLDKEPKKQFLDRMKVTMAIDKVTNEPYSGVTTIIATPSIESLKSEKARDEDWAYKTALWGGIASVCFAVGVVSLLIRHYMGRLSLARLQEVQTVDLSNLPMAMRNESNATRRNPNVIFQQDTYGWGPFRERRSRSYV